MGYEIRIEPTALTEIDEAYQWLSERTDTHADTWLDGLERAIESLEAMPERCPFARDQRVLGANIRVLIYGRYKVLFEVRDDEHVVAVVHLRHQRRSAIEQE